MFTYDPDVSGFARQRKQCTRRELDERLVESADQTLIGTKDYRTA